MLNSDNSLLIIIDIQEKLIKAAQNSNSLINSANKITKAANILGIPLIITEQYPKGLGQTDPSIIEAYPNVHPIEKTSFSAMQEENFINEIKKFNKKQIILCGIETHICVLQTAIELISNGYDVYILKDASSSRSEFEHKSGLDLLQQYGAKIISTEIAIFQWLRTSKHPHFKEIQALIK